MKTKFFSIRVLVLVLVFCFLFNLTASATIYEPGETLDPDCAPDDSSCSVESPLYVSGTGTDGQVLKMSGGELVWANDDGGTSYTAGSGLSLSGSLFSLDLSNDNIWTGIQEFINGFTLNGKTYTNLAGTGLSFSNGILSSILGTTIESSEITNETITASDIADSTITLAKFAQNSCSSGETIKWNGSSWSCSTDNNNAYTAGTGISLSSGAFSLNIDGLSAASSVDSTDTVAVYTSSGLKKITRSDMFSDVLGSMNYRGTWNATTNSPTLTSGSGTKGYYYVVSTSGTTTLDGISSWAVNDWVVFNGTAWERVQTTNSVTSVFGRTGTILASSGDYNASQITNTANGNISAITVQNALNELDDEKLSKTLNSSLLFVGNSSNVATGVSLSGDATLNNSGVLTIASNAVVLGDDTTGNYVATLADSGDGLFTIANSGSENAAVTIALADDILNFTKLSDILALDASTSITLGGNDLTTAITGAGIPKITRTSAGQWINFNDGNDSFDIYNSDGTPESSIVANIGSVAVDTTNGKIFVKTTDSLNTGWSELASASSGLLSLNGLSGQTQTFATGTSGTDFTITSSGATHTFNIPDASATSRGLVTTGAQTIAGAKTLSSALTMSGSDANIILGSNYLSGDGDDEGIYVNSSGNVGIGTTSPNQKLSVSVGNAVQIASFLSTHATNEEVFIGQSLASDDSLVVGFNPTGDYGYLQVYGDSAGDSLVIANGGNVGIGTTSPGTILDIAGALTSRGMSAPPVSSSGQGIIYFDSTSNTFKVSENGGSFSNLVGSAKFSGLSAADANNTVDNTNYVQVWNWSTLNTGTALAMIDDALTTGSILSLTSSSSNFNSSSGLLYIANNSSSTNGTVARIRSNSTISSGLTVLASGNVGIGTTSPSYLLDVAGTVNGTGLITGAVGFKATTGGLELSSDTPSTTTNKLYNVGGTLYWDGSAVGSSTTVSYGIVRYTGTDTSALSTSSIVTFDSSLQTGNMTYGSSKFTLEAGKTYELEAQIAIYNTSDASAGIFEFYDYTNGTTLTGKSLQISTDGSATGNPNQTGILKTIYTPSSNIQVGIRMNSYYGQAPGIVGSATTCTKCAAGSTYFKVVQVGSTVSSTGVAMNTLTAAVATNTIDNTNYAQTWNWSTATTKNPLTMTADALTTGSGLSLTTSSTSLASTNGLLYVANTGSSTSGIVARIASNSTSGSGLTVLASGYVGIGTTSPANKLQISGGGMRIDADQVFYLGTDSTNYGQIFYEGTTYKNLMLRNGSSGGMYLNDPGATSWTASSDQRLKEEITTLDASVLDKVLDLNPVTFYWKTGDDTSKQVGFIAQEVLNGGLSEIVSIPENPELCDSETGENCYGLKYDRFAPYLVKAIQEQQAEILSVYGILVGDEITYVDENSLTDIDSIDNTVDYIASKIDSGVSIVLQIVSQKVVAVAGFFEDIWANRTHTKELCIGEDGDETCITKDQLDELLSEKNITVSSFSSSSDEEDEEEVESSSSDEETSADETTEETEEETVADESTDETVSGEETEEVADNEEDETETDDNEEADETVNDENSISFNYLDYFIDDNIKNLS